MNGNKRGNPNPKSKLKAKLFLILFSALIFFIASSKKQTSKGAGMSKQEKTNKQSAIIRASSEQRYTAS